MITGCSPRMTCPASRQSTTQPVNPGRRAPFLLCPPPRRSTRSSLPQAKPNHYSLPSPSNPHSHSSRVNPVVNTPSHPPVPGDILSLETPPPCTHPHRLQAPLTYHCTLWGPGPPHFPARQVRFFLPPCFTTTPRAHTPDFRSFHSQSRSSSQG